MKLKNIDYFLIGCVVCTILYSIMLNAQSNCYEGQIQDLIIKYEEKCKDCADNHYVLYRRNEKGELEVEPKK